MESVVENWRKASYSGTNGGNCLEAGSTGSTVAVRDTKQEGQLDRDMLAFTPEQWQAFTRSLKVK
jgi:hypothetical protein